MVKQTSQNIVSVGIPTLLEQLPVHRRPAEQLYQVGAQALNPDRTASRRHRGQRQLGIAQSLVARWGPRSSRWSKPNWRRFWVGRQTAARIKAALELGQRLAHLAR